MGKIQSFEDLECWKASRDLRRFVSKEILPAFPKDERFSLFSQLQRSSRSIGDNISEGYGRFNYQENIQFCRIGRGSLYESLNQVLTVMDERYIEYDTYEKSRKIFEKTKALLNGYINYLKKAKMS